MPAPETHLRADIGEARAHQQNGDFGRAKAVAETLFADGRTPEEAALLHALCRVMEGGAEAEAQKALRDACAVEATNTAWQADRGLGLLLLGRLDDAKGVLEQAVRADSAPAIAFGRLAAVELTRQDLDRASELYREAVSREPGRAEWHSNFAGVLWRQHRLQESVENYDVALKLKPELEKAKEARRRILVALERTDEVVSQLEEELGTDPADPDARLRLARAYELDSRPGEAAECIRRGLRRIDLAEASEDDEDRDAQLRMRLGLAEVFTNRAAHWQALKWLKQAERLSTDPAPIVAREANAIAEMGRNEDALEEIERALHLDEQGRRFLRATYAKVLGQIGRYDEAIRELEGLLETYPGDAGLMGQLGHVLMWVGRLDEAQGWFDRAAEVNPMALANMVENRDIPDDPEAIARMERIAENPLLAFQVRQTMNFALARVYEKRKQYDDAFRSLSEANRLVNRELKYTPESFTRRVDAMMRVFTKEYFKNLEPIRRAQRTPVFVVGMPRSGTTLTEQVLSSHHKVFGAGELPHIPHVAKLIKSVLQTQTDYPENVLELTPRLREEAARHYLHRLDRIDPEQHPLVVDKLPHNFVQLGLIASIFPNAKVIHVNRDPLDTAVSNFQQNFKMRFGGMGFAFSLENIGYQINDYYRIMAHWREVLPVEIFDLYYEDLVQDQEGTTRRLLAFLGLEWEESVRDFHKTERAVRTASVTQVRQPIYDSSRRKWRRYQEHLGPLFEVLDQSVLEDYGLEDRGSG
jgi:tetratricopeptide (TPR) repeat protein